MTLPSNGAAEMPPPAWFDRPVLGKKISLELVILSVLVILAIFSRFYDLGSRVMSHDENTHVYYSWRLFQGMGFSHDPLMHGPLQFHMVALSYFMFGDNDFTSRIPAALCSILTVAFMWNFRRYLGKAGALIAAALFLISPYMLYYGRYVRNEAYVALFGVITLWAIMRYLETGQARYTYWLTASLILNFSSKETAFIFTAQALLFLALYFIYQISRKPWLRPEKQNIFLILFLTGVLLTVIAFTLFLGASEASPLGPGETASPVEPGAEVTALPARGPGALVITLGILGIISLSASIYFLLSGCSWGVLKEERSLGLLFLIGTLVLPQLSAFVINFMGINIPTNVGEVKALGMVEITQMALVVIPIFIVSVIFGLLWNPRLWLINAAIWYGIFTVLFTTVFTNGAGFFTGLVGGLGYWLEQQAVNRGSQPWYYYLLVQIPVYEYLAALGALLALVLFAMGKRPPASVRPVNAPEGWEEVPVVPMLGFWAITGLLAFSMAGEKMPWLTVHIVLPMILLAGWAIGHLIKGMDWQLFRNRRGWVVLLVLVLFLVSLSASLGAVLGARPPFQGKTLDQLSDTSTFMLSFIVTVASGIGLYYLVQSWPIKHFIRLVILLCFTFMGVLTVHTSVQSSYINSNNANELLVYAHSAGGVKEALSQIEELSLRTTDSNDIIVAYDSETSYPYYWYFRNYPNSRFYGKEPTRSLREAAAILVGDANYGKLEPVVADEYFPFEYIRLWWPNEDYKNLTLKKLWDDLRNPQMRDALFHIWLDRDYTKYGLVTGKDMSLRNWSPAVKMRLYLRKDLVSQLWAYGVGPTAAPIQADPYEGKGVTLTADQIIGSPGSEPGQFKRPHDIEAAPDGSLYVVDTDNNRIQHLTPDGEVVQTWGSFGDITVGNAPGGTFNQPWGIGLGLDGSVYVADTWNHRIQKFTAEGEFIRMWGYFGQGEAPDAFWGPRDVAVDSQGRIFVSDTGNKRVVVFNQDGEYLSQFGGLGFGVGQFDEPVGLAIDSLDQVVVADTWNQRIQVFAADEAGNYLPVLQWEVNAWYGQSLENKPYLDVDQAGSVFVADPEGARILQFTSTGELIRYWGDYGSGPDSFGLAASVSVDPDGNVWVVDSENNRLMRFSQFE